MERRAFHLFKYDASIFSCKTVVFIARRLTQQTWNSKRRQRSFWFPYTEYSLTTPALTLYLHVLSFMSFLTFSAAAVCLCCSGFQWQPAPAGVFCPGLERSAGGFSKWTTGALIAVANLVARDWFSCWCRKYIVWILFVATIIRGHWFG